MESCSPSPSNLTDTTFMACSASVEPNFQVEDLLDFPLEDDDNEDLESGLGSLFIPHATAAGGLLFGAPPGSAPTSIPTNKEEAVLHEELSHGLCVPPDELFHQLEWLSSFNEDNIFSGGDTKLSFSTISSSRASAGLTRTCKDTPLTTHRVRDDFRSESPVSVLEHGGHAYTLNHVQRVSRVRKARAGGRVWSLDILKPILFENRLKASHANSSLLVTSYSSAHSEPLCSFLQPDEFERPHKKMRQVGAHDAVSDFALVRKCTHCSVQKTPQWRAGPMGPKTLCNACGVRYKSGRLVPEYRPAASPSFVNEVHSNSHRRILEMRRVKEVESSVKHYKGRALKRSDSKRVSWIVPLISEERTCKERYISKESDPSCKEISGCEEAKDGMCDRGLCGKESSDACTVLCEANIASDEANLREAPNSASASKEKHMQENTCASNMTAACEGEFSCGKDANADMFRLDTHPSCNTIEARV